MTAARPTGVVFNIMRYSTEDGPGVRTTVFLKGCPLTCAWCHNPESQSAAPELMLRPRRCVGCRDCLTACPSGAISASRAGLIHHRELCTACGACAEACPAEAREIIGREMTVDQVMAAILRDRPYYENSGGGVTFGGGEPLSQPDFLAALLTACRAEEIPTAVDTSGLAPASVIDRIAPLTDLFLYDLKIMNPAAHRRLVGAPNSSARDNLVRLAETGTLVLIRVPFIAGINDTEAEIKSMAGLASGLANVTGVQLLPYHATGLEKYRLLGRTNGEHQFQAPSDDKLIRAQRLLSGAGLNVV